MASIGSLGNRGLSLSNSNDVDQTKRRQSSRNIKRPKFDDELVESSLGGSQPIPPLPKLKARSVLSTSGETSAPSTPVSLSGGESRKRMNTAKSQSASQSKRSRKNKTSSTIQTKDLGRWKPTDDLMLIIGIQQTCDLVTVHRGVKFSCKFTLGQLQERWYALLYDPTVSRVAQQAMKSLHADQISAIQSKALYSKAEEELLGTIKSNSVPTIETFETLLQSHPDVFYTGRTAKALLAHWQQLRQYFLLPDQNPLAPNKPTGARDFSEVEEQLIDAELCETPDEATRRELAVWNRDGKRNIRMLEDRVAHLSILVDTVTGISPPDFDTNTLAVLRGRIVRYLMRSDNITLGRKVPGMHVDVDLTLEGPAWKISRRQGIISMHENSEFVIQCEGKRPIFVDGKPVLAGDSARLLNNSVIEIGALKFIFLINAGYVNKREMERMQGEAVTVEEIHKSFETR